MEKYKLKYKDKKKMFIPYLTFYKDGIKLPGKNNIIEVTEKEKNKLLKLKNGNKNIFEEIKHKKEETENKEVIKYADKKIKEEKDNG